jgi:cobyrinic acid a,c-diamide synthase
MAIPTIVIAGTHSGSGKTTVVLAVLAALTRRGVRVQAYKVGPDFIDPGHHAGLTGRPSRNLDTWLLDPAALAARFLRGAHGADVAVVEGVMGLFDGRGPLDEAGSTADLARAWDLPVVLVVDARGLALSVAPLVRGFATFDPRVHVAGVVANRAGSRRHYVDYLAPSLTRAGTSKVRIEPLGYLVGDEALAIPSRHLGLVTADEHPLGAGRVAALADAAEATLDLDRLLALARVPRLPPLPPPPPLPPSPRVRMALARDPAFCFYYEDNLDDFRAEGAELVPFSPLADAALPGNVELVYLGGGYPEVFAERLAANAAIRAAIRRYHAQGGAILAECGGLMVCCAALVDSSSRTHSMWDLIPARVVMQRRRAALGYVTVATDRDTRLGPAGTRVRGHEYHYSRIEPRTPLPYATRLLRPDRDPTPDGIQIGGLLAGYAHMHFGSSPATVRALLGRR